MKVVQQWSKLYLYTNCLHFCLSETASNSAELNRLDPNNTCTLYLPALNCCRLRSLSSFFLLESPHHVAYRDESFHRLLPLQTPGLCLQVPAPGSLSPKASPVAASRRRKFVLGDIRNAWSPLALSCFPPLSRTHVLDIPNPAESFLYVSDVKYLNFWT